MTMMPIPARNPGYFRGPVRVMGALRRPDEPMAPTIDGMARPLGMPTETPPVVPVPVPVRALPMTGQLYSEEERAGLAAPRANDGSDPLGALPRIANDRVPAPAWGGALSDGGLALSQAARDPNNSGLHALALGLNAGLQGYEARQDKQYERRRQEEQDQRQSRLDKFTLSEAEAKTTQRTEQNRAIEDMLRPGVGTLTEAQKDQLRQARALGGNEGALTLYQGWQEPKETDTQVVGGDLYENDGSGWRMAIDAPEEARAAPEKLQYLRAMNVDPGSPEGRAYLLDSGGDDEPLVEIADPNSPTGTSYVRRSEAVGKPGKAPSGMEITTNPDGTMTMTQGRAGGGGGKTPMGYEADPGNAERLRPIPGGPADKVPGDQAARIAAAKQGVANMDAVIKGLSNPDGTINDWNLANTNGVDVPLFGNVKLPFTEGRDLSSRLYTALDARSRAMSGAAIKEDEWERERANLLPSVMDNDETKKNKLLRLQSFLGDMQTLLTPGEGASMALGAPQGGALPPPGAVAAPAGGPFAGQSDRDLAMTNVGTLDAAGRAALRDEIQRRRAGAR